MAVTLVVEDGTGLSTANTYITLAECKTWFDNHGFSYSAILDETLNAYIVRSAKALDGKYWPRLTGYRLVSTQALEWPREAAYYMDWKDTDYEIGSSQIPQEWKNGQAATVYLFTQSVDLQPIDNTVNLKMERVKIEGAIEEEKQYWTDKSERPTSALVEDEIYRLLTKPGSYVEVSRA